MKKKLITGVVAAVALLLTARGTMAWFTDDRRAAAVVQTGNVDIEIVERTNEPEESCEITADGILYRGNFMPGQRFSKIVTVRNKGVNSAYVRVKVSFQDKNQMEISYDRQSTPVVESSGLGLGGDSWELGSDGYYYYNQALAAGGETAPVMETVHLPLSWELEQTSALYRVVIGAEAIQSNYTGPDSKTAFGYQETGKGIVHDANALASEFIALAGKYNEATGKTKDEILDQIRELVGAGPDVTWWIINNNDMFRSALMKSNGSWPTVAEEGLADVLHMSEEEAQNWYVNIYVVINDNYRVVPYISRASKCGGSEQWRARYLQINGTWYQPISAPSASSDTVLTISLLYKDGWEGIRDDWKPLVFGGVSE